MIKGGEMGSVWQNANAVTQGNRTEGVTVVLMLFIVYRSISSLPEANYWPVFHLRVCFFKCSLFLQKFDKYI